MFGDIIKKIYPQIIYSTCDDSEVALRLLLEHKVNPDLIILDINMPKMTGIDMLKALKEDEFYATIPVLIYSTAIDADVSQECKSLGASEVLKKLYSIRESENQLKAFLEKWLSI